MWAPRRAALVPELALLVGLTIFLVDEPDAATSAFKSGRAVVLMAVGAITWVVGRILVARFVRWRVVGTAVFGVAALGVLAVIVLPAYDDDTVVEAFPVVEPLTSDAAPTVGVVAPDATAVATPSPPSPSPPSPPPTTPTTSTTPTAPTTPTTVSLPEPPNVPEPAQPAPVEDDEQPELLRVAMFQGIDHRASGTVALYRTAEGRHVVGLEQFDIQPGPDYDLYLVPGTDRRARDGGIRLDDLRGNQGTQYYVVPADIGIDIDDWTVLVWCQTFGVPVANATPV
jgi:Electron transfer DM13